MKTAVVSGRMKVVSDGVCRDVEEVTNGSFGPDPMDVFDRWTEFLEQMRNLSPGNDGVVVQDDAIESPVPRPRQVFGIGLNYRGHAIEAGMPIPDVPLVFTKFPSAVGGPFGILELPTTQVDWEAEVAVVVGLRGRDVDRSNAWQHVAGLTGAQDYSARDVQMLPAGTPQFSLGKSFPGFLRLGPVLVTVDELEDREDLHLTCSVDEDVRQSGSTSDLIFPIPVLIEYLSAVVTLLPGDVILTGTPAGVGTGMKPPQFLVPGQVVRTTVVGVGEMCHRTISSQTPWAWRS
jgi:2,4-didehydro-3-deoxy-L-rhamnonate hydrolase